MQEFEGIIISVNKYKDSDAILNILTKDNLIPVLGKGIFKENNKNHKFVNKFIYGIFDCYEGPIKGLKLRNVKIKEFYPINFKSYSSLIIVDFLSELVAKTTENSDYSFLYIHILKLLDIIKRENNDSVLFESTLLFIFYYIDNLGIKPIINGDETAYFSFKKGEFSSTYEEFDYKLTTSEESLIKTLYKNEEINDYPVATIISILKLFISFIESSFDIKLNSKEML